MTVMKSGVLKRTIYPRCIWRFTHTQNKRNKKVKHKQINDTFLHGTFFLISVAHSDYVGPPRGYRPMEPVRRPRVIFDYLTPNDALPYSGPTDRKSEAKVWDSCIVVYSILNATQNL